MAKSGQVIENPRRKARMTFLRTAGDTEGELLAMLAEEEPTLARAPLLRHPHQEERFEVRSGTLDYQLGEQVYTAGPGEVAVVPPGVPHTYMVELRFREAGGADRAPAGAALRDVPGDHLRLDEGGKGKPKRRA